MSEILSAEEFYHKLFEAMNAQYGDVEQKTIDVIKDRDKSIFGKSKEEIAKLYGKRLSDMYSEALEDVENAIDSVFGKINKE